MASKSPDEREPSVDTLLRKIHQESRNSPERSPFWREGRWRCEFYAADGDARLKVFSGDRCVHEEPVQGRAGADTRAQELRQAVLEAPPGRREFRGD